MSARVTGKVERGVCDSINWPVATPTVLFRRLLTIDRVCDLIQWRRGFIQVNLLKDLYKCTPQYSRSTSYLTPHSGFSYHVELEMLIDYELQRHFSTSGGTEGHSVILRHIFLQESREIRGRQYGHSVTSLGVSFGMDLHAALTFSSNILSPPCLMTNQEYLRS